MQVLQLVLHLLAQLPVERAQRLVEQHQARLEDQGARHGDPLLLAAGELLRAAVGQAVQPHHRQRARHLRSISAPAGGAP